MIRPLRVVLFAALTLQPLSALCADFVVWWRRDFIRRRTRRWRKSSPHSSSRAAKKAELVIQPILEIPDRTQAAIEAGRPPDFLFGPVVGTAFDQWAYEDRLVDLTEAVGPLASLFDADALAAATLRDGRTGKRALYTLPMGRSTNHIHVWTSLLERAGFTLSDVPKEWERFWSFWCDRVQPAVRKAIGREDVWGVGLAMSADA